MAGKSSGRVNVAIVLTGIDPPGDLGRMALVVRRVADLLGDQVVKGAVSTQTPCAQRTSCPNEPRRKGRSHGRVGPRSAPAFASDPNYR